MLLSRVACGLIYHRFTCQGQSTLPHSLWDRAGMMRCAWLIITNSSIAEHVAVVGSMLRAEGLNVVYVVPDDQGGLPFKQSEALRTIASFDAGFESVTFCCSDDEMSVQKDDILISQTPYLDDHYPEWLWSKFSSATWVFSPYGYSVRPELFISSITDLRFSWYLLQSEAYARRHRRAFGEALLSRVVSTGHPSMCWLRNQQRGSSDAVGQGGEGPMVAFQFHWTRELCSLHQSIELVQDVGQFVMKEFGQPIYVTAHPLLGLFNDYDPPFGYEVAEISAVREALNEVIALGNVIVWHRPLLNLCRDVDVLISDGESIIAFGAAVGATVSVPQMPESRDLTPEIAALPNVHRHDPTDPRASLQSIQQLIKQTQTRRSRPTYFHALGLTEGRNPIQELLRRM